MASKMVDKTLEKLESVGIEVNSISKTLVELKGENSHRDYRVFKAEEKITLVEKQLEVIMEDYIAKKKLNSWIAGLFASFAALAALGMWYIEHQRDLNLEREKYALSIPSIEQQKEIDSLIEQLANKDAK